MAAPGETVSAFLAAVVRRDLDAALPHLADDVTYDNVPVGAVRGRDAVWAALSRGVMAKATAVEWVVLRQAAEGDVVMNERLDRFLVDGRWVEIPVAGVFVVEDGRITLWRDYFDLATYSRQR